VTGPCEQDRGAMGAPPDALVSRNRAWGMCLAPIPRAEMRGICVVAVLTGVAVGAMGCRRWIRVSPTDVGSLAAYSQSRTVTVTEPGQTPITIEPRMDPVLHVTAKQQCVRDAADTCEQDAVVPLAAVSPDGAGMVTHAPPPICDEQGSFDLDQVQRAVLQLGDAGIPLSRDQLSSILAYAESRHTTVRYGDQTFEVEPAARPVLYLEFGSCSIFQGGCSDHPVRLALEAVTLEGSRLRVCRDSRDVVAAPGDIVLAELGLRHAPPFVPHTGLGFDAAGPALIASVTGQVYPEDFLVIEGGLTPLVPAVEGAWGGFRLRARATDWLVASAGASAGGLFIGGSTSDPNADSHRGRFLLGPRVALEFVLPTQRDVIRLEGQLAFSDLLRENAGIPVDQWHPWGGLGYVHLY